MFWGQVTNCFTPITNENLCMGVFDFWCLAMSSEMAWACLPSPACWWHWSRMKQALRSPTRVWTIPDIPYSSRFPSPRLLFGFLVSFFSLWLQSLWLSEVSFLVLTSKSRSRSEIRLLCARGRMGPAESMSCCEDSCCSPKHCCACAAGSELLTLSFSFHSHWDGAGAILLFFSSEELLDQRARQPHGQHPQVEQRAEVLGLSCFPSATILPIAHPWGTQARDTHLQCHHLLLQELKTTTHSSSSSEWLLEPASWIADAVLQCPFTAVVWVVVPLPTPDKPPEVGLSWLGKQHWKWASVHLSQCSWSLCPHFHFVLSLQLTPDVLLADVPS